MTKRHLIIATRESPLALQQAESIKALLMEKHPHLSVDLLGITTQGDKRLDVNLTDIGGKGLFVKELEEALLDKRADIAVHSMKDVPMELPEGLSIPVIGRREDPRDAFISNRYGSFSLLPTGSLLGTSSLRRQTQLRLLRRDVLMEDLRGNVGTRLNRLDQGDFAAIVLAAAGLKRLNLASRIKSYLSFDESLPAAGQGALGIQCRVEDEKTLALIAPLDDPMTHGCVIAERALCRKLDGGCKVPLAAFAQFHQGVLSLRGLVANANGTKVIRAKRMGKMADAESMGLRVAEELLQQGAERILNEFK